jgi:WD40 repeat protein
MRRFRFRIGSLLILIVFLGVGFAALREATDLWDSIVLTLAIGVLLVSLLLAIHRQAERRAFWVAFALFGWVYLGLTAIPSIESRLLTTRALAYLDSQVPGRPDLIQGTMTGAGNMDPIALTVRSVAFSPDGTRLAASNNSGSVRIWSTGPGKLVFTGTGNTEDFVRIGHSLFALILAWLGGKFSRQLHARNREKSDRAHPGRHAHEAPPLPYQ